jgi:hypothetical protein
LVDLAIDAPTERRQRAEENDPIQRARALQTAQYILVDLRPGDLVVDILGLDDEAPFNGDFMLVVTMGSHLPKPRARRH